MTETERSFIPWLAAWGAPQTCSLPKQSIFSKTKEQQQQKLLKISGNCPLGTEQMKTHLLKKIKYSLVRTAKIRGTWIMTYFYHSLLFLWVSFMDTSSSVGMAKGYIQALSLQPPVKEY
jgi:hypothetical protein